MTKPTNNELTKQADSLDSIMDGRKVVIASTKQLIAFWNLTTRGDNNSNSLVEVVYRMIDLYQDSKPFTLQDLFLNANFLDLDSQFITDFFTDIIRFLHEDVKRVHIIKADKSAYSTDSYFFIV